MSLGRPLAVTMICLSLGLAFAEFAAAAVTAQKTVSAVLTPGKHILPAPTCPLTGQRTRFHVTHVQASPFFLRPVPLTGLQQLDGVRWAVKVFLRRTGDDEHLVLLTAIGVGVVAVEAGIQSGQSPPVDDSGLTISIDILDPRSVTPGETDPFAGFPFNVHISGICRGP